MKKIIMVISLVLTSLVFTTTYASTQIPSSGSVIFELQQPPNPYAPAPDPNPYIDLTYAPINNTYDYENESVSQKKCTLSGSKIYPNSVVNYSCQQPYNPNQDLVCDNDFGPYQNFNSPNCVSASDIKTNGFIVSYKFINSKNEKKTGSIEFTPQGAGNNQSGGEYSVSVKESPYYHVINGITNITSITYKNSIYLVTLKNI